MGVVAGGLIGVGAIWLFVGWWPHYLATHGVGTVVDWGRAPASREEARDRERKRSELQRRQFAVLDRSSWVAARVIASGVVLVVIATAR